MNKMMKVSSKEGVTLIELIFSLAILSILLIGLLQVFTYAFSQISSSGKKNVAQSAGKGAAEDKIAAIQSNSGTSLAPQDPAVTVTGEFYNMELSIGGKSYSVPGFKVRSVYNNGSQSFNLNSFTSPH